MSKVITDKKLIAEVLTRGVEKIYPSYSELEKKLLSGQRLRLYCGFDATAPALHIGNAFTLGKLAQFQRLGHEVIFLIGDFTSMIGDPTDKKAVRRQRTRQEVLLDAKNYQKQASAYINFKGDNPAQVRYNSEWNDKLDFKDLVHLASNFTVQQMIQRDMFQERLAEEKPIYLHEFLYPLTQGYDSVAMDVDLEIGGNDQMFNMLCGRDLLKAMKNKEKSVMTLKLLADDQGKKMGKSEGNVVFLNEKPNDMYGKIMSWPDGVITLAFELGTTVPLAEIKKMEESLKWAQVNPRDLKMKLAYEITKINHGEATAKAAQNNFVSTIQKKELPEEIETIFSDALYFPVGSKGKKVAKHKFSFVELLDDLVRREMFTSKSEAKRLINEGGVKINGAVLKDINKELEIDGKGLVIQRGKKAFLKIIQK